MYSGQRRRRKDAITRSLPGPDAGARYTLHRPEQTLLHRTIREQLEGFLARSAERGHPVPRFVEQELRAFVRALFAELRRRSRQHWGVRDPQCGAVTFIQRFGSAMNLNLHFHTLALDGVYADASLIVADGVSLLWAARLQGTPLPDRVAGSDLVWLLAERAAAEGRSLYLLGGTEGVGEKAARQLVDRWPSLRFAGTACPRVSNHPTEAELSSILPSLKQADPDLIYVAFGAPKEERLIAALRTELPRAWWIGIGAGLSFVAEEVPCAPRWMQRAGVEWVHRLSQEPRRLTRRYLIEDLPFTLRLLAASWRNRGRAS